MTSAQPRTGLNILVFFASATLFSGGLWLVSHGSTSWWQILGVLMVANFGNTLFALLHESVHRVLSANKMLNETFGLLAGAFFPTGLTFQRICHLGHHLRNRTDHEMFDMYYKEDSKLLKYAQFYSILSGVYWLSVSFGWAIYLLCPWVFRLLKSDNASIKHTGAAMLHPFINHPKKLRIRMELVFVIAFQFVLFKTLDLAFWPTFTAYWIFGMYWGSLQYADHAWSERDIQTGAWNLKVNPLTRLIFLNYHHHRVHHMYPRMPWHELPKYVDRSQPQPTFMSIYLEMWKGPRPVEKGPPIVLSQQLAHDLQDEDLNVARQA